MELFEQIKGIAEVQNKAIMSGIELGRGESTKRIRELEAENAILEEELIELRYLSSNGSGGQSGNTGPTVTEGVPNGFKGVAKEDRNDRKQNRIF